MKELFFLLIPLISLLTFEQAFTAPLPLETAQENAGKRVDSLPIPTSDKEHLKAILFAELEATNTPLEPEQVEGIINKVLQYHEEGQLTMALNWSMEEGLNTNEQNLDPQPHLAPLKPTEIEKALGLLNRGLEKLAHDESTHVESVYVQPISFEVQQLPVPAQVGASCGYHTIINAKAFEDIVQHNQFLPDTPSMHAQFECYREKVGMDELEISQMLDLAHAVCLKNIYFLGKQNGLVEPAGTSYQTYDLALRIQLFKVRKKDYLFFACNTGGHWVLCAAIKGYGDKPYLFYMNSDSKGTPLAMDEGAKAFITYLKEALEGK